MRWIYFQQCEQEDYVNCYFENQGECQNPKHRAMDSPVEAPEEDEE